MDVEARSDGGIRPSLPKRKLYLVTRWCWAWKRRIDAQSEICEAGPWSGRTNHCKRTLPDIGTEEGLHLMSFCCARDSAGRSSTHKHITGRDQVCFQVGEK